jgi:hypothetical protein
MKIKKILVIGCLLFTVNIFSQAWDDVYDAKYSVAISFQDKGMGAEIGYEFGVSNYLSIGVTYGYVFKTDPLPPVYDYWGININNGDNADEFEKMNMAAFLNLHLTPFFKMDGEDIDMYVGASGGINGLGAQAGFKYFFMENLGVYINGYYPIIADKLLIDEASQKIYYDFYTQPVLSAGISFTL